MIAETPHEERELLERLLVHEHVARAVAVEVLVGLLDETDLFEALAGAVGALEGASGEHIAHFGAHEGPALAGLDVLELDHREQDTVEFEGDAVLQVVGADGRHDSSLGVLVRIRQPVEVTTTRSSIRTPPTPSR